MLLEKEFLQLVKFWDKWESTEPHEVPGDPGGLTYRGITIRSHPEAFKNGIPDDKVVEKIMYNSYYKLVEEVPNKAVRLFMADTIFNMGQTRLKFLQEAFNACRHRSQLALNVDGNYGPKTLNALVSCDDVTWKNILDALYCIRKHKYIGLSQINNKFYKGWRRRLDDLYGLCTNV